MPLNINAANHQHRFLQKEVVCLTSMQKKSGFIYPEKQGTNFGVVGKERRIWPSPQTENAILCKAFLK